MADDSVREGGDKLAEGARIIWDAINDPDSRIDLGPPEKKSDTTQITLVISQKPKE
jgi:hypothetical protein